MCPLIEERRRDDVCRPLAGLEAVADFFFLTSGQPQTAEGQPHHLVGTAAPRTRHSEGGANQPIKDLADAG